MMTNYRSDGAGGEQRLQKEIGKLPKSAANWVLLDAVICAETISEYLNRTIAHAQECQPHRSVGALELEAIQRMMREGGQNGTTG